MKMILLMLMSMLLLSACQSHKKTTATQDVARLVASVEKAAETTQATALPTPLIIKPVVYNAENLRDPFELPTMVRNTKQYANAILKDVSLESLKLSGVVIQGNQQWAMFKAQDGHLYKITQGMRVGFQQALLTKITDDSVTFTIDANADVGEKPRDVVFTVQEKS